MYLFQEQHFETIITQEDGSKACQNLYKCKSCGLEYTTMVEIRRHLRTHFAIAKCYACSLCEAEFNEKEDFLDHAKVIEILLVKSMRIVLVFICF